MGGLRSQDISGLGGSNEWFLTSEAQCPETGWKEVEQDGNQKKETQLRNMDISQ